MPTKQWEFLTKQACLTAFLAEITMLRQVLQIMKIITNISEKTDLRHSLHMVEHIRTINAIMI